MKLKKNAVKSSTPIKIRLWKNRYIYLMICPVVLYVLVFKYWPMTWLSMSFFDYKLLKGFAGSTFVGFQNFIDFFSGPYFSTTIFNTVILNVYSIIFLFPAPIIFAIMLNELSNLRVKKFIQTISYLPYFISTVILVGMIISVLSPSFGAIGSIMRFFGYEPVYFLGDPGYFRGINVVSGIWQTTGWNAIVYLSALTAIDPSLYEAAKADGAGRLQRIWHITLPGIKNTIFILLILRIGDLLGANLEKVLLLQNDLNLSVSEMLPTYIYKVGLLNADYSFATTVGLFNSLVSLALVLIANTVSKKYSESGSVF